MSVASGAVTKYGTLRQDINSTRVNKSGRTVITGAPFIKSQYLICPLDMAKTITQTEFVHTMNIGGIKKLLENYPNYPCVLRIRRRNDSYDTIVNESNKK